ncbi:unnamed protein product [Rhizoctonia solani]|uniref:Uncharacterized protein n=1 Tax=Rhizoctonia solani TaxID=456999 RepID=A0A8H3DKG5_9AGAM|nr:unnamed protein product [Rhizoctonia solani]
MSQQHRDTLPQPLDNPPVAPAGVPGGIATPSVTEQRLLQMIDDYAERLNALEKESKKQIEAMTNDITAMQGRISYHERLAYARALNTFAREEISVLQPLPLPNGDSPPQGVFPETYGALRYLEEPALTNLIRLYDLPHSDSKYEQFRTLARYFCIHP